MKTFSLFVLLALLWTDTPDKLVDLDRLTILSDSAAGTTEFYYGNLQKLWDLSGRRSLALKVATCSLTSDHSDPSYDVEPFIPGYQHVVVVALNGGGSIIETKAALPCPPHCEGGGKLITTFDDFKATH